MACHGRHYQYKPKHVPPVKANMAAEAEAGRWVELMVVLDKQDDKPYGGFAKEVETLGGNSFASTMPVDMKVAPSLYFTWYTLSDQSRLGDELLATFMKIFDAGKVGRYSCIDHVFCNFQEAADKAYETARTLHGVETTMTESLAREVHSVFIRTLEHERSDEDSSSSGGGGGVMGFGDEDSDAGADADSFGSPFPAPRKDNRRLSDIPRNRESITEIDDDIRAFRGDENEAPESFLRSQTSSDSGGGAAAARESSSSSMELTDIKDSDSGGGAAAAPDDSSSSMELTDIVGGNDTDALLARTMHDVRKYDFSEFREPPKSSLRPQTRKWSFKHG